MALATVETLPTTESPWLDSECGCRLLDVTPLTEMVMSARWELHQQLIQIDRMDALDAVELAADLVMCEIWPMDHYEIARFAGEHRWLNQAKVFRIFHQLGELSDGFCHRQKAR